MSKNYICQNLRGAKFSGLAIGSKILLEMIDRTAAVISDSWSGVERRVKAKGTAAEQYSSSCRHWIFHFRIFILYLCEL